MRMRNQAAVLRILEEDVTIEEVLEIRELLGVEIERLKERPQKLEQRFEFLRDQSVGDMIAAYEGVVVIDNWLDSRGLVVADKLARDLLELGGESVN